jgi:hypothetical protein|uniref:Uncharacterized protein n=1 Tax=uncultured marine virus TaxID=186617 RepID=A0A0F7L4L1_9VIRU|nr:hypothetical protein [uncultured marine virus]
MKEFNKKQRDYLDKVVKESPTRQMLADKLFSVHSTVEEDIAKLGKAWETQWHDLDRYVSDKFIEVHGASMQIVNQYNNK